MNQNENLAADIDKLPEHNTGLTRLGLTIAC